MKQMNFLMKFILVCLLSTLQFYNMAFAATMSVLTMADIYEAKKMEEDKPMGGIKVKRSGNCDELQPGIPHKIKVEGITPSSLISVYIENAPVSACKHLSISEVRVSGGGIIQRVNGVTSFIDFTIPDACLSRLKSRFTIVVLISSEEDLDIFKLDFEKCPEIQAGGRSSKTTESNNFESFQIRPNPFFDQFSFDFELKEAIDINISIYNYLGQKQGVLASGNYSAGKHTIGFETTELPKGYYFVRYKDDLGVSKTMKVIKR